MYHSGERAVQARAGVERQADRLARGLHGELPPPAREFLAQQVLAAASTVDAAGRVWASLLSGPAGFLRAPDGRTVVIDYQPPAGDPLSGQLYAGASIGLVVIDLAERRRARINGRVIPQPGGKIGLAVEVAYANCPKYIQARAPIDLAAPAPATRAATLGESLSAEQRRWIAAADTFFIASYHPEGGADASHRGGMPGFVQVRGATSLAWPDYAGNNMFNTLGNIAEYPHVGLLFVDFASGRALQLSGAATISWDAQQAQGFAGAERVIELQIERTVEHAGAFAGGWVLQSYSPFNPR
jgi:predicted pyridoxine 5'-phosphate oxidase superfamily flavin-nucleotide-binding protein